MPYKLKAKGRITLFCGLFLLLFSSLVTDCYLRFPENMTIFEGESLPLSTPSAVSLSVPTGTAGVLSEAGTLQKDAYQSSITMAQTGQFDMTVKLFGIIPVRSVTVHVAPEKYLVPGGNTLGIKIFTKGLVCVGTQTVKDINGRTHDLAKEIDLRSGDILLKANHTELKQTDELIDLIQNAKNTPIRLTIDRQGKQMEKRVSAVETAEGFRLGFWLRDSTAGIGTLTFFDPATNTFGALGHPITDSDTGTVMPVSNGAVVETEILTVQKGEKGVPGELKGILKTEQTDIGTVTANTEHGVFGTLKQSPSEKTPCPVASGSNVKEGKAIILSNVSKDKVEYFEVEIQKNLPITAGGGKDMIIRVTDPALKEKTGGIVQGMSGSPIIQDGKLVGAVTHVFVNDPTRGYGIFIENMLAEAG